MVETVRSGSLLRKIRPEIARRRIDAFAKRFGKAHLYFAQHAAFPLALTPDLAYRLWANFQQDIFGERLGIPWVAVADLLLSSLCDEVGHELYEMNVIVREILLSGLQEKPNLGSQRISELSFFLYKQIERQLESHDPDIRDFAKTQGWTALAYVQPGDAARELARALRVSLEQEDSPEQLRLASLIETLAGPLTGFTPLLTYARGIGHFAHGDVENARIQIDKVATSASSVLVQGISLPIPYLIHSKGEKTIEQVLDHVNNSVVTEKASFEFDASISSNSPLAVSKPVAAIKIFFCYAHEDEALLNQLKAHLKPLQHQGLIDVWHDRDISAGTEWEQEIIQQLNTSQIILLLISPDFMASEYCYSVEMKRVLERHEHHEAYVIPIILRNVYWKGAGFDKLQALPTDAKPIMSALWHNEDEAFFNITEGIYQAIKGFKNSSIDTPSSSAVLWNVPYKRNTSFLGREDVLTLLYDRFNANKLTNVFHIQMISGLPGTGKTEIAIEYAYRYHNDYQAVFWVRANSQETLIQDFAVIVKLLDLPEQSEQDQHLILSIVKRWLGIHNQWLLIFDDVDDIEMIKDFLSSIGGGHILLTTRASVPSSIAQTITLNPMSLEEGTLLLLRRAKVLAPDAVLIDAPPDDRTVAEVIVQELEGLPLGLEQAGAYIEETNCGILGFLELYRLEQQHQAEERHKQAAVSNVVKLFILGRPGSGKSSAAKHIEHYLLNKGWSISRFKDFDILQEMAKSEISSMSFRSTSDGVFEILDQNVLDVALDRLDKVIQKYLSHSGENKLILIEIARENYSQVLPHFSSNVLQNAYFLYLHVDLEICIQRIENRMLHPSTSDDYYISKETLMKFYMDQRFPTTEVLGRRANRIDNNGSFMDFTNEVEAFIKDIFK